MSLSLSVCCVLLIYQTNYLGIVPVIILLLIKKGSRASFYLDKQIHMKQQTNRVQDIVPRALIETIKWFRKRQFFGPRQGRIPLAHHLNHILDFSSVRIEVHF